MTHISSMIKKIRKEAFGKETAEHFVDVTGEHFLEIGHITFMFTYYNYLLSRTKAGKRSGDGKLETLIHSVVDRLFISESEVEPKSLYLEVKDIRRSMIRSMEAMFSYTEYFKVISYALNRYNPCPEIRNSLDSDEIAKEVLAFIFEDEDKATINYRISDILSALPVRYTNSKFYELLENAFDEYLGKEKNALKYFINDIKDAALLAKNEEEAYINPIHSAYLYLKESDFKNLSSSEYINRKERLDEAVKLLEEIKDESFLCMEVINELYKVATVMTFSKKEKFKPDLSLITSLREAYKAEGGFSENCQNRIEQGFVQYEGRLEKLFEENILLEEAFEIMETDPAFSTLESSLNESISRIKEIYLISTNTFFEEVSDTERGVVTEKELSETKERMLLQLDSQFKLVSRPIRKAIMAKVLGVIPVFLKNRTEVMDYVRTSLSTCDNKVELSAFLESFYEFRREDD